MSKYRKRFSQSEKLEILNYYKHHGGARTKLRYNVSITSIYRWHETLENAGPEGLHNPISNKSMIDPEFGASKKRK